MINTIEFFSGSGTLSQHFRLRGYNSMTLDNHKKTAKYPGHHFADFMDFDFKQYSRAHFSVLFFGFPCTTFSKASGGLHFTNRTDCKTAAAHTSIKMMFRMFEIIDYFSNSVFYIENPAGGLAYNYYFRNIWPYYQAHIYRLSMDHFNFPTTKQTDIFTNSDIPFLFNRSHRVNGKYAKNKFDNLSKRKRQTYTPEFANFIGNNVSQHLFYKGLRPDHPPF